MVQNKITITMNNENGVNLLTVQDAESGDVINILCNAFSSMTYLAGILAEDVSRIYVTKEKKGGQK